MNFQLRTFASPEELARVAAADWLDEIQAGGATAGDRCVALSGGRITHQFFSSAVAQARPRRVAFDGLHFFWADERCVPPTDPESNFKLAGDLLLTPLEIPAARIHRLRGELPPAEAASLAQAELAAVAPVNPAGQPVFDLILLGMGEDGHVASLFPQASRQVWEATAPFLVIENSPKPPPTRLSLSLAALAAARQVWVLVSGAGKANALRQSLQPGGLTPLGRVIQARPATRIYSDLPGI